MAQDVVKLEVAGVAKAEAPSGWLSKGGQKIADVTAKLGILTIPTQFLNMQETHRQDKLREAQNQANIQAIQNGEKVLTENGLIDVQSVVLEDPAQIMLQQAQRNIMVEEVNKQLTLMDVIARAESIVNDKEDDDISDEPIDADWFQSFKSYAEKATKDDLKQAWAKVLAAEVAKPGTISTRAFELICHLNKEEAERINRLASLVCGHNFLFFIGSGAASLKKYISYHDLLELESLQIISGTFGNLHTTQRVPKQEPLSFFSNNDKRAIVINNNGKEEYSIRLDACTVTSIGKSVLSVLDDIAINEDYLSELKEFLTKKTPDFIDVGTGDLTLQNIESGEYLFHSDKEKTLTPNPASAGFGIQS